MYKNLDDVCMSTGKGVCFVTDCKALLKRLQAVTLRNDQLKVQQQPPTTADVATNVRHAASVSPS